MTRYLGQGAADKIGLLAGLTKEEREVIAYGLDYLLSGMLSLVLLLCIGLALGFFQETMVILLCWTFMRVFAGGPHCTALWRCTIVNCLGMLTALFITRCAVSLIPEIYWVSASVSWALIAVWLWAPNNSERPEYNSKRRRILRIRAMLLVIIIGSLLLYFSFSTSDPWTSLAAAGATGLAAGGVMLSPAGFKLVYYLDNILITLKHSLEKGGEKP